MYKNFLRNSFILFIVIMIIIATINLVVDPGKIYFKNVIADNKSSDFLDKLINSKYGIIQNGWNERLIKTILAKSASRYDCVVLGSSHIMQLSRVRNTGNIQKQCKNLLNLGVSGGSIEDISIFSYLILNNIKLPNKVFIGIDPWTLKFNMDSRYGAYKSSYNKMNILLNEKDTGKNKSYLISIIKNLFNGEYFYYSIQELLKNNLKREKEDNIFTQKISFPENNFSYETGYKEALILTDGSHLYDKAFILKRKNNNSKIKLGGGDYKIMGKVYDIETLAYLQKIVNLYKQNNIKVNLVLTPYHPNVFKKGDTKPVRHFEVMENIVNEFSLKNNIKVYGSYFPNKIGCVGREFFDFMHGTNKCLNKIDFSK
ncbi:MAG: hypothetical protein QM493_07340 [Sulfurovum sp.]